MTTQQPRRRARGAALGVLLLSSFFLAGPTPGDIGGCGGTLADEPIPGDRGEAEYDYFDEGFCAPLCYALRECGVLCLSIRNAPANCSNDNADVFRQCVRGELRADTFGANACPHSCTPYNGTFRGAFRQDVQTCSHVIQSLSCNSLANVIQNPPGPCTAVCE